MEAGAAGTSEGQRKLQSFTTPGSKDDDDEDDLLDAAAPDRLVCTLRPGLTP